MVSCIKKTKSVALSRHVVLSKPDHDDDMALRQAILELT